MTKEKPPAELLEIVTQMVRDEIGWIKRGLADNARQLAFLDQELKSVHKEFTGLEKRVETLSDSLVRYQQTLQKVLES